MKLNKQKIVKQVQQKLEITYAPVSIQTIKNVVNAYEDVIKDNILVGNEVPTGLGKFKRVVAAAKKATPLTNGNPIPERYLPKLKFNTNFRQDVRNVEVV